MIDKVFEMLGVKPNERFHLNDGSTLTYYLDCDLNLYFDDCYGKSSLSTGDIVDILTGNVHIIPISKKDITKNDEIAIDYAKACGYKYIVQIEDGTFVATKQRPFKRAFFNNDSLIPCFNWKIYSTKSTDILILEMPISCVHSDDEEPFYIGD